VSIKPNYVKEIIAGNKRVEFRKIGFNKNVEHVIVYSSSPDQRVIGYFDIIGIDEDSTIRLWKKYKNISGLNYADFKNYYSEHQRGTALLMDNLYLLPKPIKLNKLKNDLYPPQNYVYLTQKELNRLQNFLR